MAPSAFIAVVASQGELVGSLYNNFHMKLPAESATPHHVGILAGLTSLNAGYSLAIKIWRFWRRDVFALPETTGPKLYSYAVAMVIVSVALFFVAFARRSLFLRRLAMFGVAAKIAKCFFVDTTGLVGLIRVASLSGLGSSRAGLAWINRRMTDQNNLY